MLVRNIYFQNYQKNGILTYCNQKGLAEAKVFIIQKLKFLFSKLIEQINAAGNQQKEKVTEAIKEEIKNQIQKELEERFSAAIETEK